MADQEVKETVLKSVAVDTKSYNKKDGSGLGYIYNIAGEDQKSYTTFSKTIADIFEKAGTERKIKFLIKVQGNYTNYNIVDVADENGEFQQKGKSYKGREVKADPAKTKSIERQVAAKETVNLIISGKSELKDFEDVADRLFKWITGGTNDEVKSEN